jgi:two-component system phosphate regulon response regulator PhoB
VTPLQSRILVVDDAPEIVEMLLFSLLQEGFIVDSVGTGEDALNYARTHDIDLILLDLMLPGIDGTDVLRLLKSDKKTENISIIMLTARGSEEDVVNGLELGADDYITKPFSLKVLHARMKSVLNRHQSHEDKAEQKVVTRGVLTIDIGKHQVFVESQKIDLTATEFGILLFLSLHPGWVFTRTQIINSVKGSDYPVTERAIDVQILNVRKKLKQAGELIETVRGVGYRLKEVVANET